MSIMTPTLLCLKDIRSRSSGGFSLDSIFPSMLHSLIDTAELVSVPLKSETILPSHSAFIVAYSISMFEGEQSREPNMMPFDALYLL